MELKKNILLVDDDRVANFLNEKIIDSLGFANKIYSATNGEEALNIFQDMCQQIDRPDVILLDLNMPIMGGFEFIEAFKSLDIPFKERILIILVTSSNNPEDIKRAEKLGVRHYLTKPISQDTVKSIILQEN